MMLLFVGGQLIPAALFLSNPFENPVLKDCVMVCLKCSAQSKKVQEQFTWL